MNQVYADAYNVKDATARMESFDFERQLIDWHADARILNSERYWANDMDRIMCRLRTIQKVLPPDQQAEIKTPAPSVYEVTDTTQAAIQFLNTHPNWLFVARYEGYPTAMYNEADRAEAATANSGQYAAARYTGNPTSSPQNPKTGS